jgi:hypothetical protein
MDGTVRGTVLTSWSRWSYRDPSTRPTLRSLKRLGATHVAVLATWYQPDLTGSDIAPDPDRTPDDDAVRYAAIEAREQGFSVTMKPHLDVQDGTWRGDIRPRDPDAWFAAYTVFLVHYAEMAQEVGAARLVVGTEMKATEPDERWRGVFAAAREVFDGELVYAANWDSYEVVPWWDEVDTIGVDAYFPLTNSLTPATEVIREAWTMRRDELDAFSELHGKPIVLTEFGYQDRDGTNTSPWWAPTNRHDPSEQVKCLEAAFRAMDESKHIAGGYVWKTYYDPEGDLDGFDVLGKPAEAVVRDAWAR